MYGSESGMLQLLNRQKFITLAIEVLHIYCVSSCPVPMLIADNVVYDQLTFKMYTITFQH